MIDLWLDDLPHEQRAVPPGWVHVKTVDEAKPYLERGVVRQMSLDHDLGACEECSEGLTPHQWLEKHEFRSMPNCEHFGTGYTLVCWMEATGYWSQRMPTVHSRNPAGRQIMEAAIRREYERNGRWRE